MVVRVSRFDRIAKSIDTGSLWQYIVDERIASRTILPVPNTVSTDSIEIYKAAICLWHATVTIAVISIYRWQRLAQAPSVDHRSWSTVTEWNRREHLCETVRNQVWQRPELDLSCCRIFHRTTTGELGYCIENDADCCCIDCLYRRSVMMDSVQLTSICKSVTLHKHHCQRFVVLLSRIPWC